VLNQKGKKEQVKRPGSKRLEEKNLGQPGKRFKENGMTTTAKCLEKREVWLLDAGKGRVKAKQHRGAQTEKKSSICKPHTQNTRESWGTGGVCIKTTSTKILEVRNGQNTSNALRLRRIGKKEVRFRSQP